MRPTMFTTLALTALIPILAAAPAQAGGVLYVDADAAPGGDGSSWATAFNDLTDAILAADPMGSGAVVDQLWVAEGVYMPTFEYNSGDPRSASFYLPNDLAILGGFAGGEDSAEQRDPQRHPTILEGDIGDPGLPLDNCYHVVRTFDETTDTAVLDGFTIRNGYANSGDSYTGAAADLEDGDPVFINCRFLDNLADSDGGAVYGHDRPTFIECTFIGNQSFFGEGGAVVADDGGMFIGCTFIDNHAADQGGAISGRDLIIIDSVFDGNSASDRGGAVFSTGFATELHGCLFTNNNSWTSDGGAVSCIADNLAVVGSLFAGNGAEGHGGAVDGFDIDDYSTYVGSSFFGNAGYQGGAIDDRAERLRLINCQFSGNAATASGGGAWVVNEILSLVVNCTFHGNVAGLEGGGLRIGTSGAILRSSIFWANSDSGGADESAQVRSAGGDDVGHCLIQGLTPALEGNGNLDADPLFANPAGADGTPGTADDDLRPLLGSPCIDAGNSGAVPDDFFDLDGDGVLVEPTPLDLDGAPRFLDDPTVPDSGSGPPPVVDMGCFEFDVDAPGGPGLYTGPAGGSWFEPANWAGGEVPGAMTDVVVPGPVVIDQPGAVARSVAIRGGGTLEIGAGSLAATSLAVQQGGVLRLDAASALLEVHALLVAPGGLVDWSAGTIRITGGTWTDAQDIVVGCAGSATLIVEEGGGVTAPSLEICENGVLRCAGVIANDLTNSGVVEPGIPVGTMLVEGAFAQSVGGTLRLDLADFGPGGANDLLVVSGAATIAGTLEGIAGEGFGPELGSAAQVLEAGALTGGFDTIDLPDPPLELELVVESGPADLALRTSLAATGPRLFVDAGAAPGGDAQSWETATRQLTGALFAAETLAPAVTEIWVASGTYRPDMGSADRMSSFHLLDGLAIYGGFAGGEETLEQRDPQANPVILSGDLLGNDVPGAGFDDPSLDDNCFHVVTASGTGPTALLDGVTIAAGHADGAPPLDDGAGLFNAGGSPTLVGCTFEANRAGDGGAGAANLGGAPLFDGCTFSENRAFVRGGAMLNEGAIVEVIDTVFMANQASGTPTPEQRAGGAVCQVGGTIAFEGCAFGTNATSGDGYGGALYSADGASVSVTGCTFDDNVSSAGGTGGAVYNDGVTAVLIDCAFTGNAAQVGGAVYDAEIGSAIAGCMFDGNSASHDAGAIVSGAGGQLTGCQFVGNSAGQTGGAVLIDQPGVVLSDCLFMGNEASLRGGGVQVVAVGPLIVRCEFVSNSSAVGGGLSASDGAAPRIDSSRFSSNMASDGAGAAVRDAQASLVNCLFESNTAQADGAALRCVGAGAPATVIFASCTIARNVAFGNGGGISAASEGAAVDLELTNCILWQNFDLTGFTELAQITAEPPVAVQIDFSCVQNLTGGLGGSGNIGTDPLLADPDGADYRLQAGSPCIDQGQSDLLPTDEADLDGDGIVDEPIPLDLDGLSRQVDDPARPDNPGSAFPVVDMGAYERQSPCPADLDGDGQVGVTDLVTVIAAWGDCPPGPCVADVDGNQIVGVGDLIAVIQAWGSCDP